MNFQYFGGGPDTTNNREQYLPRVPGRRRTSRRRGAPTSGWLRSMLGADAGQRVPHRVRRRAGRSLRRTSSRLSMWTGSLANQGGFHLEHATRRLSRTRRNAGAAGTTSARDAYHYSFENTLNWQKGSHSVNIGGSLHELRAVAGEPAGRAGAAFRRGPGRSGGGDVQHAANFPGASTTHRSTAARLYAILTGRVSEVRGIARLNETTGAVPATSVRARSARGSGKSGFWLQDSWRMGPNLTLNYGARYDLHVPVRRDEQQLLDRRHRRRLRRVRRRQPLQAGRADGPGADVPSAGAKANAPIRWTGTTSRRASAWPGRRAPSGGLLRRLTGDTGDFVVRAGYSRSYTRLGLTDFTGQIGEQSGRVAERLPSAGARQPRARCRC